MKSVFVVLCGHFDLDLLGIFKTEEDAERFVEQQDGDYYYIEEWDVEEMPKDD